MSFINTGVSSSPLTTVDDTSLKAYEVDNGHKWSIEFRLDDGRKDKWGFFTTWVDEIDLENVNSIKNYLIKRGSKHIIDYWVVRMRVYNEEGKDIGNVGDVLINAINVSTGYLDSNTIFHGTSWISGIRENI